MNPESLKPNKSNNTHNHSNEPVKVMKKSVDTFTFVKDGLTFKLRKFKNEGAIISSLAYTIMRGNTLLMETSVSTVDGLEAMIFYFRRLMTKDRAELVKIADFIELEDVDILLALADMHQALEGSETNKFYKEAKLHEMPLASLYFTLKLVDRANVMP